MLFLSRSNYRKMLPAVLLFLLAMCTVSTIKLKNNGKCFGSIYCVKRGSDNTPNSGSEQCSALFGIPCVHIRSKFFLSTLNPCAEN